MVDPDGYNYKEKSAAIVTETKENGKIQIKEICWRRNNETLGQKFIRRPIEINDTLIVTCVPIVLIARGDIDWIKTIHLLSRLLFTVMCMV